ncbi:hypothetical protein [Methylotenera sp.]|uniref:hypothetical protein n=1 Tax=Methylotenera sp. TaxID=2051956 RepID=UPI00248943BE|nr:hypothetical protein [Methylotenera sp.]MDI1297736.1 hypothetical protein [Methylotenera sp.]
MQVLNKTQAPAFWNKISISLLALACIGALLTNHGLGQSGCGTWGLDCFVHGILVAAGICLFGVFAAFKALSRHESKVWLSWLAVHGLYLIAVLIAFLMVQ